MRHVDGDPKTNGEQLRARRKSCGLDTKELASKAGLSEKTIKDYESGTRSMTDKSYAVIDCVLKAFERAQQVRLLRPKLVLGNFDAIALNNFQKFFAHESSSDGGTLPYLGLSFSPLGIEIQKAHFAEPAYQLLLHSQRIGLSKIARQINAMARDKDIELVCLTCGHDWLEMDLAYELSQMTDNSISISMIHPSRLLLQDGTEIFRSKYKQIPNLFWRAYASTYEVLTKPWLFNKQRRPLVFVVCIFGTLNNFDQEKPLLQFLYQSLVAGDLLVIDTIQGFSRSGNEKTIHRLDPRLNGNIPNKWNELTQQLISHTLRMWIPRPLSISIESSYAAHARYPDSLNDYAINISAAIDDGVHRPWRVSGLRIHRQSATKVTRELEKIGWRLIMQQKCALDETLYPTNMFLFTKSDHNVQ